jgi:hypothetical protein
MRRLIETLQDATQSQIVAAVLIALATWLGVSGAIWNAYPGSVWPFIVGTVPAILAYGAVIVVTELKEWY